MLAEKIAFSILQNPDSYILQRGPFFSQKIGEKIAEYCALNIDPCSVETSLENVCGQTFSPKNRHLLNRLKSQKTPNDILWEPRP
jgi:hypothetical protein